MAADDASPRPIDANHLRVPRPVLVVFLSWLAMVGVDLFLHAGLLAPLYDWDSPFVLPPEQAVVRIPAGYVSLLLLAIVLVWVLPLLRVRRGGEGALFAAAGAAVVSGAFLIGLWSISTAEAALLAAWWLGQTAQLALGGYIVGASLAGDRPGRLLAVAATAVVLGAVSAVVLQSSGYAEAPVMIR
ncbi:MAG TPA: hypothetical protein VFY43_07035 [Candidatus Limnocylindria bacterium]|nr:hypothetical protein [Candidatus Limnocylindria bacterium]